MWKGDYFFLLSNLVQKDFKIRYRNMSLGMFWSLLNPLVMMTVMTFVFTKLLAQGNATQFAVSVLCGLVPFNFFSLAWSTGTSSLADNVHLVKRVPVPRNIVPIASVLSNCLHFLIQIGLLLVLVLVLGRGFTFEWLWLPLLFGLEIVFTCGMVFITSAAAVYVRDTRYVVESANTVLFWLVPIVYSISIIAPKYVDVYQWNPLTALVICVRRVLIDGLEPHPETLFKLGIAAAVTFVAGYSFFESAKKKFYEYL